MPKVTIELRADAAVKWRDGKWVATDDRAKADVAALSKLCTSAPERPFARAPEVLDVERAARIDELRRVDPAAELPDLNRFFVVEGDPKVLAAHPFVANVAEEAAPDKPAAAPAQASEADRRAHEREACGQGVCIATLGPAADLKELAPEAELEIVPGFLSVADAIDRATSGLAFGDVMLVPFPVSTPVARAAAAHAIARGVLVVAASDHRSLPIPGALLAPRAPEKPGDGPPVTPTALAARAACAQSYAVASGLGRLGPRELGALEGLGWDLGKALDAVDALVAARPAKRPFAKVTFEKAAIIVNGDIGAAEIYFEGWIDDGAGGRRAFRIPHEGYIPGVKNGQVIPVDTVVFESKSPVGESLRLHFEAWDEDLGRTSLVDPDDLLGACEHVYGRKDEWGEGRHADVRLTTDAGEWLLTYRIDVWR